MGAPDAIRELVRRFEEHREAYQSGRYNETQLRREFLDPFCEALGWDVNNRQSHAEADKEVIYEDAVKVGGLTKAPDYSFRIGGARKFFVEAKKPSVSIKNDPGPAFQLRRYAWSAKLPLSILTDFDEFAVYDCRRRPDKTDKSSLGRVIYLTCAEFDGRWEEIAGIFAKESKLKGSFDRFATAGAGAKRGTAGVDAAFLAEIEGWRDLLARSIALRNPDLSVEKLNFAVQRTIDRIIFLRICEDRGIEDYGSLLALVNGENTYGRLRELYRRADERYNSGLFHFRSEKDRAEHPDTLTPRLAIDDKPLEEIIRGLYYPDSPYEFPVLPADILGQVYEQFLGKVIRLTAGHRAVVEEKPEVKKAGGVYYTPTYIVDYIVRSTVGKLLEGKTPKTAAELRILDPACGSGSFLIGAYQHLLDWHRDWYATHDPEKWAKGKNPPICSTVRAGMNPAPTPKPDFRSDSKPGSGHGSGSGVGEGLIPSHSAGDWRLTTAERKRILLSNIYGVDIDSQAVEVTKLSLLLKVLEGENEGTLARQLRMFHERALPDLGKNIKCGNSLIGPDSNDGKQLDLLSGTDQTRINAFDWPAEFPEIFPRTPSPSRGEGQGGGGFDAVIGNPPYVRIQTLKESAPLEVEYFKRRYRAAGKGNYDIYVVFVERGLELLNAHGRLGFILPHKFFNAKYGEPLRGLIAEGKHLAEVVHFGDKQVFQGASTYTCLMFLEKAGGQEIRFFKVADPSSWYGSSVETWTAMPSGMISTEPWIFSDSGASTLLDKLRNFPTKLEDVTSRIFQGLKTSADKIYIVEERGRSAKGARVWSREREAEYLLEPGLLHPHIKGGDSRQYSLTRTKRLILFPYARRSDGVTGLIPESELKKLYPLTWRYLEDNRTYLADREDGKMRHAGWYGYVYPKALDVMPLPKIFTPDIAARAAFSFDETGDVFFTGGAAEGYGILVKPQYSIPYILGLLNSKLLEWFIKQTATQMRGGYFSFESRFIRHIPIRTIDFSNPADKRRHDELVSLVERMLDLHKKLPAARTDQEKTALQRQIADTDRRIDRLVYDLYGLTDAEIAVVEQTGVRG